MAMHVVPDQVRPDETRSSQTRRGQVRSDRVKWDQVHPMLVCAQLSATLHTIHYVLAQRASTTLHVCEARRDQTKRDRTHTMEVRSDGMGSSQVRSSQTKQMYQYVRAYTASVRLVYRGKMQMQ